MRDERRRQLFCSEEGKEKMCEMCWGDMFVPDFMLSLIGWLATVGLKIWPGGSMDQNITVGRLDMQGRLKREF